MVSTNIFWKEIKQSIYRLKLNLHKIKISLLENWLRHSLDPSDLEDCKLAYAFMKLKKKIKLLVLYHSAS
jgi:hypothetical protein